MTSTLYRQVWSLVLSHQKREILFAVIDHADSEGNCAAPGVPYLKWKTDYSERQIQRLLRELENDGLLIITDKPFRKPTVYSIDLSRGVTKDAFIPRGSVKRGDITTSPLNGDSIVSPIQETRVTSHENVLVVRGDSITSPQTPNGDTASRDLSSSSFSLPEDHQSSDPQIESGKENARDSSPMPAHMRNGLGRTAIGQPTPIMRAIESHRVYIAFVKGWDADAPVLNKAFADATWDIVKELDREVEAGRITLLEIEETTRWKLSKLTTGDYRIGYVREHIVLYRKYKQAVAKSQKDYLATPPEPDGQKYISGPYAHMINH